MKGIKCWRSSPGWQVLVHSSVWWWPHAPLPLHDVPCLFSSSLLSFPEDAGDIRAWDDLSVPRTVCGDWVNNKQPNRRSRPAGFSIYPPGYQASWEDLAFPLKHLLYGRRLQISFPVPLCFWGTQTGRVVQPHMSSRRWSIHTSPGLIPPRKAASTREVHGVPGGQGWEENKTSCF